MSDFSEAPLIVALEDSTTVARIGGKAAQLSLLARAGFRVPPGLCVTTVAYDLAVQAAGLDAETTSARIRHAESTERATLLAQARERLGAAGLPPAVAEALKSALPALRHTARMALGGEPTQWAVRSSAVAEDAEASSYSGLYHTALGASSLHLPAAIVSSWVSVWTEAAFAYADRMGHNGTPIMGVLIQPLLSPVAAGVAYSCHPITRDPTLVVINAAFGLGEPVVSGRLTPDEYVVKAKAVVTRTISEKSWQQVVSHGNAEPEIQPVPSAQRCRAALRDAEILELAEVVKRIEQVTGHAVDVEWARTEVLWILQARPVVSPKRRQAATALTHLSSMCVWSRANFMETLPELPSPLSLGFVQRFMESNILNHYRKLGCHIPAGLLSVQIVQGRPYINVTLFQSLMAQLGSDPRSIAEYMGGEETALPENSLLPMAPLSAPRLLLALGRLQLQIWYAGLMGPRWFTNLTRMANAHWDESVEALSGSQLIDRMARIHLRLEEGDLTFALVSGVSQAFYVIGATLARRLTNWRPVLNAATQGLGTIISARQIVWLQDLAELSAHEPAVHRFFTQEPWQPADFRTILRGSRFLARLEVFLQEYGHRAVGESDVMSPRFSETPDFLLEIIRRQRRPTTTATVRSQKMTEREQAATRTMALATIRQTFGVRLHEWIWFLVWYRVLSRFLALREANRHALMHYVAAARRLLQRLGKTLRARGVLQSAEDVFYLTEDEVRLLVSGSPRHGEPPWQAVVDQRRQDRQRHANMVAPHTLRQRRQDVNAEPVEKTWGGEERRGLPISAGVAEGPVRLVLRPTDLEGTEHGDIVVAAALDPGMATVFGLAGGVIVEMGGILSHGAIIAREYGLPAVANLSGATTWLKPGERVRLDADRGTVTRIVALG